MHRFLTLLFCLLIPFTASAAPVGQVGLEAGYLNNSWDRVEDGGTPVLLTGGVLIKTKYGFFLRPHLAAGRNTKGGIPLLREGLLIGVPLGESWSVAAGGLAIQAFTPDKVVLNPGGNVSVIRKYTWGALYSSAAATKLGPIGLVGVSLNL